MANIPEWVEVFVKSWNQKEALVKARREGWTAFLGATLRPNLARVCELLKAGGIGALVIEDLSILGIPRIGIRLDTRATGLSRKEQDGSETLLREQFADLSFEQQPSGIVRVLRWEPYFEAAVIDKPRLHLAREFDPAPPLTSDAGMSDVRDFLNWSLARSYRGEEADSSASITNAKVSGFEGG